MVELDDEVEGFVPTTQMGKPDLDNPSQAFSEGEQIPLQVIELDKQAHKVVLSVQAYYKKREQNELDEFIAKHPTRTVSMGDSITEEVPKTETSEPESAKNPESTPAPGEAESGTSEEEAPGAETPDPVDNEPAAETPPEEAVSEEEKPEGNVEKS
jgi:predicted RNA-binding protein with RPS1 domain